MSEADSKDFVCKYSHEKYKMEFLLQNLKMSKKTLTLFQIWITICLKIKCCLTVYIETLVFYYLINIFPINVWFQKMLFKIMMRSRFSIF